MRNRVVTRWGAALLAVYVGLGVSGMRTRKAVASAVCVTALLLVAIKVVAWR
jgi:hypothetical protein